MMKFFKRTLMLSAAAFTLAAAIFSGCFQRYPTFFEWAVDAVDAYYLYDADLSGLENGDIEGLVARLDRYSRYYTAEEYRVTENESAGKNNGVGISSSYVEGKGDLVVKVTGNSPAFHAGIKKGEFITSVVSGQKTFEVSRERSAASVFDDLPNGENFTIVTDKSSYTLQNTDYYATYASLSTSKTGWAFGDGARLVETGAGMEFLPEDFAYMSVTQFTGNVADEFGRLCEIVNSLDGCDSLIIDLRNNGGGYVSAMQKMAGCFAAGTAMTARYKNGVENFACEKIDDKYRLDGDITLYVLANCNTASASEAFMGALISYGRLDYNNIYLSDFSEEYLAASGNDSKNCRTYGKGIMQTTYYYKPTGEALKLTTARIYWPDGSTSIHDRGITADDGCKTVPAEWNVTYSDDELKTAVLMMSGQK